MNICVASGKGGTGKTMVSVNLAASIQDNFQLLDCDVEAPNAQLFIDTEFNSHWPVNVTEPKIDFDKCNLCGLCTDTCRFNALAKAGNTILVFPKLCHSCGGCSLICPEKAIREQPREIGQINSGSFRQNRFYEGRTQVGEAMSPPLIRDLKKSVEENRINILDSPPGTSCPMITTVQNADFVVLVSEPTPFGLHDLKLAVSAIKSLGLPGGLIINRANIGDDAIRKYAEAEGLPILMEIPFSRQFAEICARGDLIVETSMEWKTRFRQLIQTIKELVNNGENVS